LRRCVRHNWHATPASDTVTLDAVSVAPPGFLVATPAFRFTMPATDNILDVSGRGGGRAAAYGYAAMLSPLSPGAHTLVLVHQYVGYAATRITYQLTVS
jgi:hypothetical protein